MKDLEERVAGLEERMAVAEVARLEQWKILLRLARNVAVLSGVPEEELSAEDEVIRSVFPGWRK